MVTPWRIKDMFQEIMKIVEDHGYHISHCFREANKPADKLASLSHGAEEIHVINSLSRLRVLSIWICGSSHIFE